MFLLRVVCCMGEVVLLELSFSISIQAISVSSAKDERFHST
jgi:hypothetical protein